jgi:hypothetical protein
VNKLTFQADGLIVIDDLLAASTFSEVRKQSADCDYQTVHVGGHWHKVWKLWDGDPMRGMGSVTYDPRRLFPGRGGPYPTKTAVDVLVEAVVDASKLYPGICGKEDIDWGGIEFVPWIYPVGSALSLHCDGMGYSGAFTYYTHSEWGEHWGGELVVMPPVDPSSPPPGWMTDEQVTDSGIGLSIAPRPNRLVLMGANRPHRIVRVDRNAGAHMRLSVAGFFLCKPQ